MNNAYKSRELLYKPEYLQKNPFKITELATKTLVTRKVLIPSFDFEQIQNVITILDNLKIVQKALKSSEQ